MHDLSHAYGHPPSPAQASELLLQALEMGVTHFDAAALHGFGANEQLWAKPWQRIVRALPWPARVACTV